MSVLEKVRVKYPEAVVRRFSVDALALLPYLDRSRAGTGRWFARERRVANTIFTIGLFIAVVLTIVGTYFRGPNWGWVVPWKETPGIVEGH